MRSPPTTPTPSNGNTVPEQLPALRQDQPEQPWALEGFFILPGMVLFWLLPKRVGPHLASAGWTSALLAHLIAVVYGFGLIAWATLYPDLTTTTGALGRVIRLPSSNGAMTADEWARAPVAALVSCLHAAPPSTVSQTTLWNLVFIELGVLGSAFLVMPFAAGGESVRQLFGRCLRMALWSSTILLPVGVLWLARARSQDLPSITDDWIWLVTTVPVLPGMWWLFVLSRSCSHYTGPAHGPAWQPRAPRCERCGYNIAHLSVTSQCPECAFPICDSLLDKRYETSWARARGLTGRIAAFWPTIRAAALNSEFFDHVVVHRGHHRACSFCIAVSVLNALMVFLAYPAAETPLFFDAPLGGAWPRACLAAAGYFVFQIVLVAVLVNLVAVVRRTPLRPTASACMLASAGSVPWTLGLVVMCSLLSVVVAMSEVAWQRGYLFSAFVAALASIGIVSVMAGFFVSVRCVARAWVKTRFANA